MGFNRKPGALALAVCLSAAVAVPAADRLHHDLEIDLDPVTHRLEVVDTMTLPDDIGDGGIEFLLNDTFTIVESKPNLERMPTGDTARFFGLNAGPEPAAGLELARYRLTDIPANRTVVVSYSGSVDFGLSDQREEYTRGFRETVGIVGEEGVYLAGNGFWVPYVDDDLIEFALDASVPAGWHLISQGNGVSRSEGGRANWESGGPVDEIFLVGGPLRLYSESTGVVEAQVYLRQQDDALATKYLEATARYLEMYRGLIGPYPYAKFALVENFWETGYGMPSFTLLGPTVIRFPFILNSSYPHEILHNWWGNSVFVDFSGGNWSEGLTAYLADHLIQEQRGTGEEYRRSTLQKYRNYVQAGEDFPLTEFRSRHSAATEAVGYGKTLMVFHMLRRQIGDEAFSDALARFYRRHRGKRASFEDLRAVFEESFGRDLSVFFKQWVERPGALDLELDVGPLQQDEDGSWVVSGRVTQRQAGGSYEMTIPVVTQFADSASIEWGSTGQVQEFHGTHVGRRPLAVHVDPWFDLFRVLDPREIPPSIGQIFGDSTITAVLPGTASDEEKAAYRDLVESWQSDSHAIELVSDVDLDGLPAEHSTWILGRDNSYRSTFTDLEDGIVVDVGSSLEIGGETIDFGDHSLVVLRRHPRAPDKAIGWIVVEPKSAFAGLSRKLPHYGKYSYLAFEGSEPTNVVKGQWDTADSPLLVDLRTEEERGTPLPPIVWGDREPLATLAPAFSEKRLMQHVEYLTAKELGGRVPGSAGIWAAASYIARQLRDIGLEPGGDDGTYFQSFVLEAGPEGTSVEATNVIGVLPGVRADWEEQTVVVSAHYDHLGTGWPDVHQGDEGVLHPGADDNASGVAVLLELARSLAGSAPPNRTIVFAAFSGEEASRAGSRHFVENPRPVDLAGVRAVINLDTVGRLNDGEVTILGTGTADEWQHIFRGASYVTGVKSRNVPGSAEASDQMSFIERGVPGVQLFTGAHEDYHRPGDVAAKVDGAGLAKVATLAKEAVVYLGGREEPLTVTIEGVGTDGSPAPGESGPASGRRVRIGTTPDFAFPGPGVRVESVGEDSPASKAGIEPGDVLLRIEDRQLTDLRAYSDALKTLEPGEEVSVLIRRGDEELVLVVTVEAR